MKSRRLYRQTVWPSKSSWSSLASVGDRLVWQHVVFGIVVVVKMVVAAVVLLILVEKK